MARCQMSGYGSSERLPECDNSIRIPASDVHEIRERSFSIAVEASFARLSFASTVSSIFQCKNIRRSIPEKFIDDCAVSHVPCVAVECEECKFRGFVGNPPSVELRTIIRGQPDVLDSQTARIPIACEAARVVRKRLSAIQIYGLAPIPRHIR